MNFQITLEVEEMIDGEVLCERYTLSRHDFPDDIEHISHLTIKPRRSSNGDGDWQYCQYTFMASPRVSKVVGRRHGLSAVSRQARTYCAVELESRHQ